jgi:hypothetical protein
MATFTPWRYSFLLLSSACAVISNPIEPRGDPKITFFDLPEPQYPWKASFPKYSDVPGCSKDMENPSEQCLKQLSIGTQGFMWPDGSCNEEKENILLQGAKDAYRIIEIAKDWEKKVKNNEDMTRTAAHYYKYPKMEDHQTLLLLAAHILTLMSITNSFRTQMKAQLRNYL